MPAPQHVSITPLLKRLWPSPADTEVTADEVALAISHVFTDALSPVQTGALLTALHFTGWDRKADVIAKCASVMRDAAAQVDIQGLEEVIGRRGVKQGGYQGGLCDIVGTGGDGHSTFNVSTASSIVASTLLLVAKHGNQASTSKSGSADLIKHMCPAPLHTENVTPATIQTVFEDTNYAFLYAPIFHPGLKYVATVRKELGWRTIFNLLGPLTNPVEAAIEARIVGVARRDLGLVFAEALRINGAKKAMVVCGEEDLDEISCAGKTFCWRLLERPNAAYESSEALDAIDGVSDDEGTPPTVVHIEHFEISPSDFGLSTHPLSEASGGKLPRENAEILRALLQNEMHVGDPILDFVLLNTAALLVITGVCDDNDDEAGDDGVVITETGPGGGRWKEGVRRARLAIESGQAWESWSRAVAVCNSLQDNTK